MVNDNSWAVGEKGQPTVAGFQDFAVGFAEMINKEVSGYYLSNPQAPNTVNTIYMGRHVNNTATKSHKGSLWGHLPNMQFNMQDSTDWLPIQPMGTVTLTAPDHQDCMMGVEI